MASLLMYFTPPSANPQTYLPSLFHLWKTLRVSKHFDFQMLDYMSRLAADGLNNKGLNWGDYGIFETDQINHIFSVILALSGVTVASCPEPYHTNNETRRIDHAEIRKAKPSRAAARLLVSSLGGSSDGILDKLTTLIQALESFFHPSNQGKWSKGIFEFINLLVEYFLLRYNQELEGEAVLVPKERHLTPEIRKGFVMCLKNVVFFGIYSKNRLLSRMAINCLHGLAFLEPDLIIPQCLKEAYPSLQGLVETHRTITTLQTLIALIRIIAQSPRYRIHITTLLSLALPGIDANDLDKTFQALSIVHLAALNVPFVDVSQEVGVDLAYEYVSRDVELLESGSFREDTSDMSPELCGKIAESTSSGFPQIVDSLFERLFGLLENLPDVSVSSKERDFPEAQVVSILTPMLMAVLGGVSEEVFEQCCRRMADFIGNSVFHSATDAIANMSGAMVRVNAKVACKHLLPVVLSGIKLQIESNGAGSTRAGSEILPRDRALIWHLSVLNLCVAHANIALMDYQKELSDMAYFLREKCKGSIIFHSANTIHHILMSLTNLAVADCNPGINGVAEWGKRFNSRDLEINWYVPSRPQVEFASRLFSDQATISIDALTSIIEELQGSKEAADSNGNGNGNGKKSLTELSDTITRHVTYLRTSLAGMSVLFDPSDGEPSTNPDPVQVGSDDGMSEESRSEAEGEEEVEVVEFEDEPICDDADMFGDFVELKKLREYPSGYFFPSKDDPLYQELHLLRRKIGQLLHDLHSALMAHRDSDISAFKSVLFAYKVWLSDVGIEKTSKSVIIQIAAYSYEVRKCNTLGLRKDYPRAVLARRALAHHHERLLHKFGARAMSKLERVLLMDILKSCLSIYPDIRRNAQSSLESAIKTIMKCRPLVLPFILKASLEAIQTQQWEKAVSGCLVLEMSVMHSSLKRNIRHLPLFTEVMVKALEADNLLLNRESQSLLMTLLNDGFRLPSSYFKFDDSNVAAIAPKADVSEKIAKMLKEKKAKREEAIEVTTKMDHMMNEYSVKSSNWKVILLCCSIQVSLNRSFEMKTTRTTWSQIANGLTNKHPMVSTMYYASFEGMLYKVLTLAANDYDMTRVTTDDVKPGQEVVTTGEDFSRRLLDELDPKAKPSFYLDIPRAYGWLIWPRQLQVMSTKHTELELSDYDKEQMGGALTEGIPLSAVEKLLTLNIIDADDESEFSVETCGFVASLLRLVDMGFVSWSLQEFLDLLVTQFDPQDKHSHRTTAEYFGGCFLALKFLTDDARAVINETVVKLFSQVMDKHLSPDNVKFWWAFVSWSSHQVDHRLWSPLVDFIRGFRLNPTSNMAFKEVAKLEFYRRLVYYAEWQLDTSGMMDDLWSHVDHMYANVRGAIAVTLAEIYRVQYHESDSYTTAKDYIQKNLEASSLGMGVYTLPERLRLPFEKVLHDITTASDVNDESTLHASKTVVAFIQRRMSSSSGRDLVPLLDQILPALLGLLLVRDDPEVVLEVAHVVTLLGDIPVEHHQLTGLIDTIVTLSSVSVKHRRQKLALLSFIQSFYFRHQFGMTQEHRKGLLECVTSLLHDKEVEIRTAASKALAGILHCLPIAERDVAVRNLHDTFRALLIKNPALKGRNISADDRQAVSTKRHAAVLGMGTIVNAFPYQSPPPAWVPGILVTLATKAGSDSEYVGRSVKEILSDFKRTRQDTWHIDSKVFTEDQLADLEGVLWKPYFV